MAADLIVVLDKAAISNSGTDKATIVVTAVDSARNVVPAAAVAVSVDSKFSLRAYAGQEGYSFDLLADFWPHGGVARAYGVFDEDSGMAKRGTFIIDAGGVIRYTVVNPRGEARDFSAYRTALAGLEQA